MPRLYPSDVTVSFCSNFLNDNVTGNSNGVSAPSHAATATARFKIPVVRVASAARMVVVAA